MTDTSATYIVRAQQVCAWPKSPAVAEVAVSDGRAAVAYHDGGANSEWRMAWLTPAPNQEDATALADHVLYEPATRSAVDWLRGAARQEVAGFFDGVVATVDADTEDAPTSSRARVEIDATGETFSAESVSAAWDIVCRETGLSHTDAAESGHWDGRRFLGGYPETKTAFSIDMEG